MRNSPSNAFFQSHFQRLKELVFRSFFTLCWGPWVRLEFEFMYEYTLRSSTRALQTLESDWATRYSTFLIETTRNSPGFRYAYYIFLANFVGIFHSTSVPISFQVKWWLESSPMPQSSGDWLLSARSLMGFGYHIWHFQSNLKSSVTLAALMPLFYKLLIC